MPLESSLPLVVTFLLGAVGVFFVWLRMQSRRLLAFGPLWGSQVSGLSLRIRSS